MRTGSVALAVAVLIWAAPGAAQVDICSSRKIQASAVYFQARANCVGKGLAKGIEPDALCISKALAKLQTSFGKAEAKGSCTSLADLAPAEDVLADALDDGVDTVSTTDVVCCDESGSVCTYRLDAQDCTDGGGTAGLPGSVCQGDGTCGSPSAQIGGPCCEGVAAIDPTIEGACATGPVVTPICADLDLPFSDDAWCHPGVGCVNASQPPRTRCTSGEVKAIGKHLAAVLQCNAKALKKSLPVDLVCLGNAESKLTKALTAARKQDDCMAASATGPLLTLGNEAAELVVRILHPTTRYCCELVEGCFYTTTGPECSGLGGQPIGSGECDADGSCKAPPLEEGGCCEGVPLGAIDRCVGGTTQVECQNLQGEYVDDALCLAAQVCID